MTGKSGRTRVVPLHPILTRELETERLRRMAGVVGSGYRYTANLDGPWLFPGRQDGHLNPAAVGRAASHALGGPWTGHTLRHRFGTKLWSGTHDLFALQTLLGHAKADTSRGYTQVADQALTDAVNSI